MEIIFGIIGIISFIFILIVIYHNRFSLRIIKIEKGSRKKWSFEEVEKLKLIYPEKGRDSYLFFEGRTQEQVCGKAKELNPLVWILFIVFLIYLVFGL